MSATFIFLMIVLKLPIAGLFFIVWYAIQSPPEPDPLAEDDGGIKRPLSPLPTRPHPRPALPRHPRPPRRGPHGAPRALPPPRVRTVVARSRRVER